jgi:hypothetical protein
MIAEFKFGHLNLDTYRLGDRLCWHGERESIPKERPNEGNYLGEAYVECPICGWDFWLEINVQNDFIESVEINTIRQGYIPP